MTVFDPAPLRLAEPSIRDPHRWINARVSFGELETQWQRVAVCCALDFVAPIWERWASSTNALDIPSVVFVRNVADARRFEGWLQVQASLVLDRISGQPLHPPLAAHYALEAACIATRSTAMRPEHAIQSAAKSVSFDTPRPANPNNWPRHWRELIESRFYARWWRRVRAVLGFVL